MSDFERESTIHRLKKVSLLRICFNALFSIDKRENWCINWFYRVRFKCGLEIVG